MPVSLPGDVSVEHVPQGAEVYVLRGHGRHQGYGSPIVWSAIVMINDDEATICGLEVKAKGEKFTRRHAGAIKRWLIDHGVTLARWERLQGNGFRDVEVSKEKGINND